MDGPAITIDRGAGTPLGEQLTHGLRRAVLDGGLRAGDALPSSRALAGRLGVSRGLVVRCYEQLAGEGYLETRQGAPTRVAELAGDRTPRRETTDAAAEPPPPTAPRPIDLLPGRPSVQRLDARAWRSAWRRAGAEPLAGVESPLFGEERLRRAIADHLRHARGVAVAPDDVVVTAGTSEALSTLALALAELRGRPPVFAVEDPGYPSGRRALARHGAVIRPVPVTDDGIDVAAVAAGPAVDAVMVTPSHQYPLGGRLPVAARLALIEAVRTHGALLVEDDYDSEFRHGGTPLPALASLDAAGSTVLVGSFSKVLSPAIRLGYLVVRHAGLRAALAAVRRDLACPVPSVAQTALALFLDSGALRRHIAATRRDYAHRRSLVARALEGLAVTALDGGLHAVVALPDAGTAASVVARLAADGVAVASLSGYAVSEDGPAGIVLGYGAPGDTQLDRALVLVRRAVEEA